MSNAKKSMANVYLEISSSDGASSSQVASNLIALRGTGNELDWPYAGIGDELSGSPSLPSAPVELHWAEGIGT